MFHISQLYQHNCKTRDIQRTNGKEKAIQSFITYFI